MRERPDVSVGSAQLAWAWRNFGSRHVDRTAWERAARFGAAANRLILDWMDCAPDRLDELDALILPLDDHVEQMLRGRNRGALYLGAHVGVVAAGVHFVRSRRSPLQIMGTATRSAFLGGGFFVDFGKPLALREVLRAIDGGISVGMTGDNPHSRNTATATLADGTRVRLMRRIPRLIWKHRIDCLYGFPLWQGDRIRIHIDANAPSPEHGEPYPDWEARWLGAYLAKIMNMLRTGPENLRLSGGFWENI